MQQCTLMGREEVLNITSHSEVKYYPVGMWPLANPEGVGGQRAPTAQRYKEASLSVYRHTYRSVIQYQPKS